MSDEKKIFFGEGLPYLDVSELRGKLIVIEGTDGVGRSTQIEDLKKWLEVKGYGVTTTGWTRSPLMKKAIDHAKAGHTLNVHTYSLLYVADFADRMENEIIPALRSGFIVLADRYIYTAFARSVVRGATREWIMKVFGFALEPHAVFYMKIGIEDLIPRVINSATLAKRYWEEQSGEGMDYWESGMDLKLGEDFYDSFVEYQKHILAEFEVMADRFNFKVVNAAKSFEDTNTKLKQGISEILEKNNTATALAAVDIGTNSFHLIIANVNRGNGRFRIIDREKEIVRLGSGPADMKHLSDSAMNRGIEALKRFKLISDAARAPIRAIATSAVREALNQDEFVRRAHAETDIKIEIASGFEEARLVYLGVLQALPVFNKQILLVDIGGGSTEYLVGLKRNILSDSSLKLGAVRLTQRFFPSGEVNSKSVKKCREFISGTMNPVSRQVKQVGFETVIGTSGTILNIAKMIRFAKGNVSNVSLNNFTFTDADLKKTVDKIIKASTAKQRLKIKGLDPARADIIVAGALVLEQSFKELNIKKMTVSEFALREGILLDTIEKRQRKKNVDHLNDLRYSSVIHLAESLHYEREHAHHVGSLALRIFDQTKDIHHLGHTEREFLEAAAILHEVGVFLSHAQHHRHSYYLIRNAELLGMTEHEKEIIANIARYHRKSAPKYNHDGFNRLSGEHQAIVRKLSAILRIADGLDRTHSSLVTDVLCKRYLKSLTCKLKRARGTNLSMEVWGANRKKDLFEETFATRVKFILA